MRSVNKVALVLAAVTAVVTVVDVATLAITGHSLFFTQTDPPMLKWVVWLVFVAANVAVIVVLVRNRSVIDAGHRSRTVLRLLTIVALVAYLVIDTAWAISGVDAEELWHDRGGSFPWWFTLATVIWWIGLIAPAVLGITMLVQGDRSPAAWLLAAAVAVYAITFWGPSVGSHWITPAYSVVVLYFGLALLGAGQLRRAPHYEYKGVLD